MDTLLSLSDDEIEAINPDNELVSFDHIKKYYSPSRDLNISYLLGSAVVTSSRDWVGLFRHGWTSTNSYLTYQWAPQTDVVWFASGRRRVIVPRSSSWALFNINDKFQLLYVTSGGDVIGVSPAFAFGSPDIPELHFDVLESISSPVVESFSNNFVDFSSLETLTLSSDSGTSSCVEADPEDEDEDVDRPIKLAWDSQSLAGDFTGKSWYQELELLKDENIVKEYDPNMEQTMHPCVPLLWGTSSSTANSKPVTQEKDNKYYALFFDEEDEGKDVKSLFRQEEPKANGTDNPLCKAVIPAYSSVPVDLSSLWTRHEIKPSSELEDQQDSDERDPVLDEEGTKLPFHEPTMGKTHNSDIGELEEGNGDMKMIPLYDVNEDRRVATSNAEKNKQERVKMALEITKSLIRAVPLSALPRPLSCAPGCIACVVSRFMLGHYQQRLLEAEERAQQLEDKTTELQKNLDAKEASMKCSAPSLSLLASRSLLPKMVTLFVKKAEETIALLDEALALSPVEKRQQKRIRSCHLSGTEKSQQTDVKFNKDVSTECVASEESYSFNSDDEEKKGWKVKNSRKIHRLKKTVASRNKSLQQAQEVAKCQQSQILLYQDVIKELRRNIREERRHVKSARQEILKLRRQVKAKLSSQAPWANDLTKKVAGISNQQISTAEAHGLASLPSETPFKNSYITGTPTASVKPFNGVASTTGSPVIAVGKHLIEVSPTVFTTQTKVSKTVGKPITGASPDLAKAKIIPGPVGKLSGASSTLTKAATRVSKLVGKHLTGESATAGKPPSGVSPFYPNKKAFRQDMNSQIKEGRCRMCGMNFSYKTDRRLIEEHITYHLQFNL